MLDATTHVELLKIATQIEAQDKNRNTLSRRLSLPMDADTLTVVLAIAQELRSALATALTPPKP